jgi:hypothetical protein
MNEGRKPGLAFWAAVALVVVPAMYPVAWGPWIWFEMTQNLGDEIRAVGNGAFAPLEWLGRHHLLPDFYVGYLEKFAVAAIEVHS